MISRKEAKKKRFVSEVIDNPFYIIGWLRLFEIDVSRSVTVTPREILYLNEFQEEPSFQEH